MFRQEQIQKAQEILDFLGEPICVFGDLQVVLQIATGRYQVEGIERLFAPRSQADGGASQGMGQWFIFSVRINDREVLSLSASLEQSPLRQNLGDRGLSTSRNAPDEEVAIFKRFLTGIEHHDFA